MASEYTGRVIEPRTDPALARKLTNTLENNNCMSKHDIKLWLADVVRFSRRQQRHGHTTVIHGVPPGSKCMA